MYKDIFVEEFQKLIKDAGIRQKKLADAIDVSGAAISQFMNGVTLPTFRHMDIIFSLLKTPADRAYYIKNLLAYARSDNKEGKFSTFNRSLLTMRHNSGYSIPRLSSRIGIPVGRLNSLETDPECIPTEDELARLKDFFGCSPDEFANYHVLSNAFRCADHDTGIPKINYGDLLNYDGSKPLYDYAKKVFRDHVPRDFDGFLDPVIVEVNAEVLGFPYKGILELTLASRQPLGFIQMTLSRYPDNVFYLEQNEQPKRSKKAPLWSMPVTELKFIPAEPLQ